LVSNHIHSVGGRSLCPRGSVPASVLPRDSEWPYDTEVNGSSWNVQSVRCVDEDEEGNSLDLTLKLSLAIVLTDTCPYQVARDGWPLWYGDWSLECMGRTELGAVMLAYRLIPHSVVIRKTT